MHIYAVYDISTGRPTVRADVHSTGSARNSSRVEIRGDGTTLHNSKTVWTYCADSSTIGRYGSRARRKSKLRSSCRYHCAYAEILALHENMCLILYRPAPCTEAAYPPCAGNIATATCHPTSLFHCKGVVCSQQAGERTPVLADRHTEVFSDGMELALRGVKSTVPQQTRGRCTAQHMSGRRREHQREGGCQRVTQKKEMKSTSQPISLPAIHMDERWPKKTANLISRLGIMDNAVT